MKFIKELDRELPWDIYCRLSEQEKRSRLSADQLTKVQEEMKRLLQELESRGIDYHGPAIGKIKDTSIPHQISLGLDWCKEQNVKPGGVFVDYDISGSKTVRKNLDKIIKRAKAGVIAGAVIKDLDRLARFLRFQEEIWAKFDNWGKQFRFVYGDDMAQDKRMRQFTGMYNEHAIDKGKDQWKARKDYCIKYGIPVVDPPWGYKWNKNKDTWLVDKKEAPKVLKMFINACMGTSYKKTCEELQISVSKYYKTLRKPRAYGGYVCFYEDKKDHLTNEAIGKQYIEYEGNHQALLSPNVLAKIEAKFGRSEKKRSTP